MPKVIIAAVISSSEELKMSFITAYQSEISSSPSPTTVKPMTLPAEKAMRSPRLSPSCAAAAVRQFACVAMVMPIKPERPEKKPPVTKAKGTNHVTKPAAAMPQSTTNIHAKKIATVRYCRLRNADAPVRMAREIFCISGVPSENARTFLLCSHANTKAITLAARLTQYRFSMMVFSFFML